MLVPQMILVPYLIGTIGENGYGIYALVWSLMLSIDQLERSLQSGVVKYSAGFLAQGRIDEVNKVVSSSFVYAILVSVVACAGTLIAAEYYKDPSGQIGSALVVVGVMVLFIIPLTPYMAVIQSRQRYYVGATADTVSKYVNLLVIVAWFHIVGPSVKVLIIIMAGTLFISRLTQMIIAYRFVPGLHNSPRLFNGVSFKLIAAFGGATVLASVSLAANTTGIRWLMNTIASTNFVTHLAIMLMPGMLLSQITGALTITAMPATSAYEAVGNQKMLKELLVRGMRYTTILVLAGMIVAGLMMKNVLYVWVGSDYVFLAPYALILFASQAFMQSTSISHHMLKGIGKLRVVVLIYWFGLVLVPVGLILFLFQTWHNPYIAVTAGLATGHLVCGCLQIGFSMKAVHAHCRDMLVNVYVQPLTVAALVYLIILTIVVYSGISGFIGQTFIAVLAVLSFLVGSYFLIAAAQERQQFKELIRLGIDIIADIRRPRSEHWPK